MYLDPPGHLKTSEKRFGASWTLLHSLLHYFHNHFERFQLQHRVSISVRVRVRVEIESALLLSHYSTLWFVSAGIINMRLKQAHETSMQNILLVLAAFVFMKCDVHGEQFLD